MIILDIADADIRLTSGRTRVHAKDFGVIADGVTNNDFALMGMRSALAGPGKPHFDIVFPSGQINYSNPRFLFGIENFTAYCHGASFLNTNASAATLLSTHLALADPLSRDMLSFAGGYYYHSGALFNNASIGDKSIFTTVASDASVFSPGARVFLYFFDVQFGGYPPNARYFEWHVVEAVNPITGEIALRDRLRHTYYNDVRDNPGSPTECPVGRPRVVLLDRTNDDGMHYAENVTFLGGRWLKSAAHPESSNFLVQGRNVTLRGVRFDLGLFTSMSEHTVVDDCSIAGDLEIDKMQRVCEVRNSSIGGRIVGATGVNTVILENNKIAGCVGLSPRSLVSRGNIYSGKATTPDSGLISPFYYYSAGSIVSNEDIFDPLQRMDYLVNTGDLLSLTVAGLSGGNITLPDGSVSARRVIAGIRPGTRLRNTSGIKFGVVSRLSHDGAGNFVIEGNFDPPPLVGETWHCGPLQSVECRGYIEPGFSCRPYRDLDAGVMPRVTTYNSRAHKFAGYTALSVRGGIARVHATISKPYSGSVLGVNLAILEFGSFANIITMPANATGDCEVTRFGAQKSNPTSIVAPLSSGYYGGIFIGVVTGGGVNPSEAGGALPHFDITIETVPA